MIRRATLDDVTDLAQVHRESRAVYYGTKPDAADRREEMWEHFLRDPGRMTYVAEVDGELVGLVSRQGDELAALYVLPRHLGTGVGAQLYERYESELDESGRLEVWAGNERAIGFYERRGWTRTDASRDGPGGHDYVTYELSPRRTP